MKKKEIPYKRKMAAFIILLFLIFAAAAVLAVFGVAGLKLTETVNAASYSSKSEIDCEPNISEDPYYNGDTVEFGSSYITKYVESVDLGFSYDFDCDAETDIAGVYSASALLQGVYNDSDLLWEKEYVIMPETAFAAQHTAVRASLPFKDLVELAENMQDATGVIASVNLTVTFTVRANAAVCGSTVSDTHESTLVLPVTGDVLSAGGEPADEQSGTVETEFYREILPQKETLTVSVVALILLMSVLSWLLLYTRGVRGDPVKRGLDRIYKKYGSRIVEISGESEISDSDALHMNSFRDLLLTADELRRPIFKSCADDYRDTVFRVIDKNKKYVFSASALCPAVSGGEEKSGDKTEADTVSAGEKN